MYENEYYDSWGSPEEESTYYSWLDSELERLLKEIEESYYVQKDVEKPDRGVFDTGMDMVADAASASLMGLGFGAGSAMKFIGDALGGDAESSEDDDFLQYAADYLSQKGQGIQDYIADQYMEPGQQAEWLPEMGKAVGRGTMGLLSGVGDMATWAGEMLPEPGSSPEWVQDTGDWIAEKGQVASDFYKDLAQKYFAGDPEVFGGSFEDNPSMMRALAAVAEASPSLAAALGAGAIAGPSAAAIGLGGIAGAGTYTEARDKGLSPAEASKYGAASWAQNALLEKFGLDEILKGKSALLSAVKEGGTEAWQQFNDNAIAKYGFDEARELTEGVIESAIGGFGSGGVMGGATQMIQGDEASKQKIPNEELIRAYLDQSNVGPQLPFDSQKQRMVSEQEQAIQNATEAAAQGYLPGNINPDDYQQLVTEGNDRAIAELWSEYVKQEKLAGRVPDQQSVADLQSLMRPTRYVDPEYDELNNIEDLAGWIDQRLPEDRYLTIDDVLLEVEAYNEEKARERKLELARQEKMATELGDYTRTAREAEDLAFAEWQKAAAQKNYSQPPEPPKPKMTFDEWLNMKRQELGIEPTVIQPEFDAEESAKAFEDAPPTAVDSAATFMDGIESGEIDTPYYPSLDAVQPKQGGQIEPKDVELAQLPIQQLEQARKIFEARGRADVVKQIDETIADKKNEIPQDLRWIVDEMDSELRSMQTIQGGTTNQMEATGESILTNAPKTPQWFGDINKRTKDTGGFDRKAWETVLNKVRAGEPLTDRQHKYYQEIITEARKIADVHPDSTMADDVDAVVKKGYEPVMGQNIPITTLNQGDRLLIGNEVFRFDGVDDNGDAVFQDGRQIKVDPFETIQADGLKRTDTQPQQPMEAQNVKEAQAETLLSEPSAPQIQVGAEYEFGQNKMRVRPRKIADDGKVIVDRWSEGIGWHPHPVKMDPEALTPVQGQTSKSVFDLKPPDDEDIQFKEVYHGTPHTWDPEPGFPHGRPRLDKIFNKETVGEGAWAYGAGWYSAEEENVGKGYRDSATKNISTVNLTKDEVGTLRENIERFKKENPDYAFTDDLDEIYDSTFRKPSTDGLYHIDPGSSDYFFLFPENKQPGSLYKLDIPDDVIPQLLDWDLPLSEQTEHVKKALEKTGVLGTPIKWKVVKNGKNMGRYGNEKAANAAAIRDRGKVVPIYADELTPEHIYALLARKTGSQQAASEYLASIGIPGNTHGGVSKGATGAKYVIWDQKVLDKIALLERNQKKLAAMQESLRQPSGVANANIPAWAKSRNLEATGRDDGGFDISRKGKKLFTVRSVNPEEVQGMTGKPWYNSKSGETVAGWYDSGNNLVAVVKKVGDSFTIDHEFTHFIDPALSPSERAVLDKAAGKAFPKLTKAEARASFVEQQLRNRTYSRESTIGKILQKIHDWIDSAINAFKPTALGIVRGAESGRVADRVARSKAITEGQPMFSMSQPQFQPVDTVSEEGVKSFIENTILYRGSNTGTGRGADYTNDIESAKTYGNKILSKKIKPGSKILVLTENQNNGTNLEWEPNARFTKYENARYKNDPPYLSLYNGGFNKAAKQGYDAVSYSDEGDLAIHVLNKDILADVASNPQFQPVDVNSPEFKEWFGDSVVTENGKPGGKPLVVYHGTGADFEAFDNRGRKNFEKVLNAIDGASFFTDSAEQASAYAGPGGKVVPVYLKIVNPVATRATGEYADDMDSPISEAMYRMGLLDANGNPFSPKPDLKDNQHDGIINEIGGFDEGNPGVKPQRVFVTLSPTQIKSAISNTGAFSKTDPRIQFSTKYAPRPWDTPEVQKSKKEIATALVGEFKAATKRAVAAAKAGDSDLKPGKKDISGLSRIFGLMSHFSEKVKPLNDAYLRSLQQQDDTEQLANSILNHEGSDGREGTGPSRLSAMLELRKTDKPGFRRLENYINWKDTNKIGYRVSKDEKTGKLAIWKTPDGKKWEFVKDVENEALGWKETIDLEVEDVKKLGFTDLQSQAVKDFREMSHLGYNLLKREIDKVISGYESAGKPLPEFKTMGADGKPNKINLKEALAKMGDQRGWYMPRIREKGKYAVTATGKAGANRELIFVQNKAQAKLAVQKYRQQGFESYYKPALDFANDAYEMAGQVTAVNAMLQTALDSMDLGKYGPKSLKELGLYGRWAGGKAGEGGTYILRGMAGQEYQEIFESFGGEQKEYKGKKEYYTYYQFDNAPADIEEQIMKEVFYANGFDDTALGMGLTGELEQVFADFLRQRGAMKHKIGRDDSVGLDVWKGYETDPLKAITVYTKGISGATAKHQMALDLVKIISGKSENWDQYKARIIEETGTRPKYEDYKKHVDANRIDPREQKEAFGAAKVLLNEMLRNEGEWDRIAAKIKTAVAVKYLGGRVFSGAVNLSSLVTSVPAVISNSTGVPIHEVFKHIGNAFDQWEKFSTLKALSAENKNWAKRNITPKIVKVTGKNAPNDWWVDQALMTIYDKGWHKAQFNQEALAALRGGMGEFTDTVLRYSMFAMGLSEKINRVGTLLGAYNAIRSRHKGTWDQAAHDAALEKAKKISDAAHGTYHKANKPEWAKGDTPTAAVMGAAYTFQKFFHTYLLNMKKYGWDQIDFNLDDGFWRGVGKGIAGNKSGLKNAAWLALSTSIFGGIGVTIPAKMIFAIAGLGGGPDDPEEAFYDWLDEKFGKTTSMVVRQGPIGLTGVSLKGSVDAMIPMLDVNMQVTDLLGAPGALAQDLWEGGNNLTKGEYKRALEKILPIAAGAGIRAGREYNHGVTTASNAPLFYGKEQVMPTFAETIIRGMGGNPARISAIREKQWSEKQVEDAFQEWRRDIGARVKKYYLATPAEKRDPTDYAEIVGEIAEFNAAAKNAGFYVPLITSNSVRATLKRASTPPKKEQMRRVYEEEDNESE